MEFIIFISLLVVISFFLFFGRCSTASRSIFPVSSFLCSASSDVLSESRKSHFGCSRRHLAQHAISDNHLQSFFCWCFLCISINRKSIHLVHSFDFNIVFCRSFFLSTSSLLVMPNRRQIQVTNICKIDALAKVAYRFVCTHTQNIEILASCITRKIRYRKSADGFSGWKKYTNNTFLDGHMKAGKIERVWTKEWQNIEHNKNSSVDEVMERKRAEEKRHINTNGMKSNGDK